MSRTHSRMIARSALVVAAWAGLGACSGRAEGLSRLRQAIAGHDAGDVHDPCILLMGSEAVPYVGALATPPYRASDGLADVHGDQCIYRGRDGRQVAVQPDWTGGGVSANTTLQSATQGLGNALATSGATGMDTMSHRIVKAEIAGPWEKATWIPGGSLLASKGSVSVQVDVSGASGQEADAVALAKIIMPRFDHPLAYDGAKAVAFAPRPVPHPARACDLVPRAVVEAAIGPLSAAPASDAPETSCSYRVASPQGERVYEVAFTWQGGQKNYTMLKHQMATVAGVMGTPASSPLDTMKLPPQMQGMMGGMMKMVGASAAAGKAPGAASTIGFQTDTTLAGPWDHAALLHGTQLMAVRHDVFVGMNLESADYAKAKALLAVICSRLQ